MTEVEIKHFIYRDYNLNRRLKIRNIDLDKKEFTIRMGDTFCELPFSKQLLREIKLKELGL